MSQTATIELEDWQTQSASGKAVQSPPRTLRRPSQANTGRSIDSSERPLGRSAELPSPVSANSTEQAVKWNQPRGNIAKTLLTFYSLFMCGANDAAYGALIPYIQPYYNLEYLVVSLIFLSPFCGYVLAALSNNSIHTRFGQRGIAILGPLCRIIAYAVIVQHPPYPVVVVIYAVAGYGIGVADAAWNAFVGPMANANELLGFMHGFYGLGATLSPLVATSLITKAGWHWYSFYYLLLGGLVVELTTGAWAFWGATGAVFRQSIAASSEAHSGSNSNRSMLKQSLFKRPSARVTWLCATFLLGYVGVEVALGGWIVEFMLQIRDGTPFASGMVATGFWLGLTMGRFILGFVTPRIGEKLAISIYLPLSMGLQLLFWLIPSFIASSIAVSLEGFFLGPLFPAAVVATTKLLPKHLHVSALGFATAFGGCGAAIFPFLVGAIANATSVTSLQPVVLAILVCCLACWLGLPRVSKKRE